MGPDVCACALQNGSFKPFCKNDAKQVRARQNRAGKAAAGSSHHRGAQVVKPHRRLDVRDGIDNEVGVAFIQVDHPEHRKPF